MKKKTLLFILSTILCTSMFSINAYALEEPITSVVDNQIIINCPTTTSVIADCDGTAYITDENTVVIEHDNEPITSTYTDLDEPMIEDGQHVNRGDRIGRDIDTFNYEVTMSAGILNCDLMMTSPLTYPYEYDIADLAVLFVGNKYVWGGTSFTHGTDCSGFTQSLYKIWWIDIPRTADAQWRASTHISEDELRKGDLIFYGEGRSVEHVAIYLGDGRIVHASNSAPYPDGGIKISDDYKYRHIVGFGRF